MADGKPPEDVLTTAELADEAVEELVAATGIDDIGTLSAAINALPPVRKPRCDVSEQEDPDEFEPDGRPS